MKTTLKLIILITTLIFFLHTHSRDNSKQYSKESKIQTVKIGAMDYPPYFDFQEGNQVTGIGIERVSKLFGPEVKIRWVEVPLVRGELALTQGHIDFYAAYTNDTNKYSRLAFTETPYMTLRPQLCGKNLNSLSDDFNELNGKTILTPSSSDMIERVEGLKGNRMKVDEGNDYVSKCLKLIKLGRANYFFTATDHFVSKFKSENKDFNCVSVGPSFDVYLSTLEDGPHLSTLKSLPNKQTKNSH